MMAMFRFLIRMDKFILLACFIGLAQCQYFTYEGETNKADDLTITLSQKKALDEFKKRVTPILPHDYMKEDIYLIRWLRVSDFDLQKAEKLLNANLEWRKKIGVDDLDNQDFSDIEDDFPVHLDTVDKKGQVVVTAIAGQWDLRQVYVTGRYQRMYKYLSRILDKAAKRVREEQQAGKNVTRFSFILNMDGFNWVQHGCPRCMLGILEFLRGYEQYYPGIVDKIVIINAPPALQLITVFRPIIRSTLSSNTLKSIHLQIFGTDKREWQPYLLKYIDADQLTEEFGGTKKRKPATRK